MEGVGRWGRLNASSCGEGVGCSRLLSILPERRLHHPLPGRDGMFYVCCSEWHSRKRDRSLLPMSHGYRATGTARRAIPLRSAAMMEEWTFRRHAQCMRKERPAPLDIDNCRWRSDDGSWTLCQTHPYHGPKPGPAPPAPPLVSTPTRFSFLADHASLP